MNLNRPYQAKKFNLSGLNGISDQTMEMHFKLYEGYVKETNALHEKISAILKDGKVDLDYKPAERSKYIEAFFSIIDWNVIEQRIPQRQS
jgi:superoxide dismutase